MSCVTQRMQPLLLAVSCGGCEERIEEDARVPAVSEAMPSRRKERREEPRPALTRVHQCLCPVKRMTFVATVPVTSCRVSSQGCRGKQSKVEASTRDPAESRAHF